MKNPALRILIIEADPGKEYLLENTIAACELGSSPRRVQGVEEALSYLSGAGRFADRRGFPLPSLILLDLRLPDGSGLSVLEWLQGHGKHLRAVVIVLCASRDDADLKRAAALRAHSYLVKPVTPSDLCAMIESLKPHWSDSGSRPG